MGPWGGESETAGGNLAVFRWKMAGRWVYDDDDDDVDYFNLITSGLNSPHSSTDVECSGPKFPVVLWTDPSTSSSFVIEYIYIYIWCWRSGGTCRVQLLCSDISPPRYYGFIHYIPNIIITITHLFLGVCGSRSPMRLSMLGSRSLVQPNVATILSLQLAQQNVALQSASLRIWFACSILARGVHAGSK